MMIMVFSGKFNAFSGLKNGFIDCLIEYEIGFSYKQKIFSVFS